MIASRFSAPSLRSTKQVIISRLRCWPFCAAATTGRPPAPQRVRARPQDEALLQVLRTQHRPEVPVQRIHRNLQRPFQKHRRQRPVRTPFAEAVHHGRITFRLESPAQPTKIPSRHPDPRYTAEVTNPSLTCSAPRCHPSPSDSSRSAPLPDLVSPLTKHDPKETFLHSLREGIPKPER